MKNKKTKLILIYLYMIIAYFIFMLLIKFVGVLIAMDFAILNICIMVACVCVKQNGIRKKTNKIKYEEPIQYELDNINNLRDHKDEFKPKYNECEIKAKLDFLGESKDIILIIETIDENKIDKIDDKIIKSIEQFLKIWNKDFQETIVKRIIKYYNEEEKYSYGPDDAEENKKWWPELNTVEEMKSNLIFNGIAAQLNSKTEEIKIILLFSHYWGMDNEGDDNGVGISIINGKIKEIGYQTDFF